MTRLTPVIITLLTLSVGGLTSTASAQPTNDEVRLGFGVGWQKTTGTSPGTVQVRDLEKTTATRAFLGYRHFWDSGHGLLVDLEHRNDVGDWICILSCADTQNFLVGHVGYGYRHVIPLKKETRAFTLTPHISLSTGLSMPSPDEIGNHGVVGGRVGLDADFHFKRYFFGWGLAYEALVHTKGPLKVTHNYDWNFLPVFRFGFNL